MRYTSEEAYAAVLDALERERDETARLRQQIAELLPYARAGAEAIQAWDHHGNGCRHAPGRASNDILRIAAMARGENPDA